MLESSWEAYRGDQDVSGLGGDQKPLLKARKALGNPSCRISMAADDTDEPIHFLMNWSRQKGWSRIYHSTSSAFPIAQVKLYSSTQKLLSTKEDVLKKNLFL